MANLTNRLREGAEVILDKASDLQERIRQRAHAIWEREGRPHGRETHHWHEAEAEVAREETAAKKAKRPKKATSAKDGSQTAAEAKSAVEPAGKSRPRAAKAAKPAAAKAAAPTKRPARSRKTPELD